MIVEQYAAKSFVLQQVAVEDVIRLAEARFNSCNHWPAGKSGYGTMAPADYRDSLFDVEAQHWIHLFHKNVWRVPVEEKNLEILQQAAKVGKVTGGVSSMWKEEIKSMAQELEEKGGSISEGFFVRTDSVSLKYGMHGIGPYRNWQQVLESTVTCPDSHGPVSFYVNRLRFYVLPWKEIEHEFRIFVFNRRVVAVSQQHPYRANERFPQSQEEFMSLASSLVGFCNECIARLTEAKFEPPSYVMDVGIEKDGDFYFIELNPFGKEYSSGSALFHWIHDGDILTSKEGPVIFRFAK